MERNESVYIWHDIESRAPFFEPPDIFADFGDNRSRADYYPQQRLFQQGLEMHPQYVLENGVDFAHFKYVHDTPIVPVFTRHDFDDPVSYVDFTITFEGDDGQKIEDVSSGVEAINGGLGIAVTKSWGMIDNRTISAITPVDESTSDVRFMVYIGRRPGSAKDPIRAEVKATEFGRRSSDSSARTSTSGLTSVFRPACAGESELEGFTAIRKWAMRFYPDGKGGSAANWPPRAPNDLCRKAFHEQTDQCVPGRHRQRRLRDDQAHRAQPDLELVGVHCYSPDKIGRTRRARGAGANGVTATGTIEEILAAETRRVTFHGVFPDEDLYVRVLEAGINVVTTADWITGQHRDSQPSAPSGKPVTELLAGGLREGRFDVLRHRDEPRPEPDPRRRVLRGHRRDREHHHDRVGRRVVPPLRDTWKEVGYGLPVDDPECRASWRSAPGLRRRVLHDGRLLRPGARRGRLHLRARRVHQGRRPGLV